ncbi:MAG: nitrous oxide reductase accessory protein NosL [Candidatus Magnetobacterium sp. LHC-1]|uniref:Nitrous oxide reductase accessory protein NosL n=1 Tax=Candidatus Magnetobacterium casense TaxID=1455061 RepID=A0ABS6RXD7_9BACT|nr:nitrous oxide reductase accessory protein NosL [Candidatus Magnetobacterium casensis]MBF0607275.1 nitrous oxide reductase accessory protein NosL [Nitrospirota bacterium]MBV6341297.1 nitrous oxide reductase accessory protein NosL [Candidatus Magnetobacterium casensis]
MASVRLLKVSYSKKRFPFFFLLRLLVVVCMLLVGCSKATETKPGPVPLTREHFCSVCRMILLDFPGAKGQIIYTNGRYDLFCGTVDLFTFYLQPDSPKGIAVIYVNDMGKEDWLRPSGHWIDAKSAFYAYGGQRKGAMGDPLVPFSDRQDAEKHVKEHGGKILGFGDLTIELLNPVSHHR